MSTLNIIATPIGNRKDITLRALEVMFSVDILLCEDTRKTKQLMDYYSQQFKTLPLSEWLQLPGNTYPRLLSYFEHNEDKRIPEVLEYLHKGLQVGLVTNAGTPGISDPGYVLVKACKEAGYNVTAVPGVCAATTALSISGLAPDKWSFLGFLPRKAGKQTKIWDEIKKSQISQTIIFYESPYRIAKTLETIQQAFGDSEVTIARELTKVHEEIKTLPISQWQDVLKKPLKGELVVLFRTSKEEL